MKRTTQIEAMIVEALSYGEVKKALALRKQLKFLRRLETDQRIARCFMAAREVPLPAELLVEPILN